MKEKISNGYVHIRVDGKYVARYIFVWEQVYGKIPKGFCIHHINGIRDDDRIENLMLLSIVEHSRLHGIKNPPKHDTWIKKHALRYYDIVRN